MDVLDIYICCRALDLTDDEFDDDSLFFPVKCGAFETTPDKAKEIPVEPHHHAAKRHLQTRRKNRADIVHTVFGGRPDQLRAAENVQIECRDESSCLTVHRYDMLTLLENRHSFDENE